MSTTTPTVSRWSSLFRDTLTVQPWTAVLERLDGRPTTVLGPGSYVRERRATYEVVDLRERITNLPVQEIPTADGTTVKVTAMIAWRVEDPVAFDEIATDPVGQVYAALQVALRELVAEVDVEDVAARVRGDAADALTERVRPAARRVGIEVLAVEVKDVILPIELRTARARLVVGRYEAQAKLEAARAETAALRSLANGAKVLADNPALARLRMVEALPPGSSVTLIADREVPDPSA